MFIMYAAKVIIVLLLVSESLSQDGDSSTVIIPEDESDTSSITSQSNSLEDNSTETVTKFDKTNQTDINTDGDIIITSEPETGSDVTSNDNSTPSEENTTDFITTNVSVTTEITTQPVTAIWTACSSNPCKNGGLCEESSDPRVYNCNCARGYTGTHCQVYDDCSTDENGNICNKGTCTYRSDGLSRFCSCFFGMFWDDDLKECREADPSCFPNPCHNGTCISNGNEFRCFCNSGFEGNTCQILNECGEEDHCDDGECVLDSETYAKHCKCNSGFYWNSEKGNCGAVVPPCLPNPCRNKGTCEVISTKEFNCICTDGYKGSNCEIQDFCLISKSGDDICENGNCVTSEDSMTCVCNEGYYLEEESHTCKSIVKPCLPNPCLNNGKCTPLPSDSYNCTCSEGYLGATCNELDFCVLKGGNTFCGNAECRNDNDFKIYYCSCGNDQYFDYSTRTCIDVDFCPFMKCGENEECKNSICECKQNYKRENSTDKCKPHFCPSNPCPVDDLICTEGDGISSYKCSCKDGYAFDGAHCNAGDVCVFPSLNECDQSCTLTEDGYACTCYDDQFVLNKDNTTCEYIGNTTCVNKTCANGICLKTGETETCICRPGYEELEGNCVDLCSVGHLPEGFCPDNKCESTDSGFRCKCEGKYALSDDEVTCTVRRMCKEGEVGWTTCSQRNALCVDDWTTLEGFTCKCMEGQIAAGNGLCRNVCSIEGNQKACAVLGAECDMDENGDKTCNCPPLFQPFINGTVCNKPAPFSYLLTLPVSTASYRREETAMGRSKRSADLMSVETDVTAIQKDVRKALEKLFPELIHSNILNCNENKDYATCKIEVQFISITEENLKRLKLPDICRASSDMPSECLIPPSLVLRKEVINTVVSVQRTDPCDEDIKENLCGSETYCISLPYTSIFECKCSDGFTTRAIRYPFEDGVSYIESCKDIDECATGNPCQENMECHNILGGYMCSCKSGYRIKDPSRPKTSGCVAICNPNPCVHGDCSALGDNDFECRCSAGYNGKFCDLQDENFKRAKTNTIIVGAVLGGILLIVIIISFAIISRLKKKKSLEDNDRVLYGAEMAERRGGEAGTINNAYQRE